MSGIAKPPPNAKPLNVKCKQITVVPDSAGLAGFCLTNNSNYLLSATGRENKLRNKCIVYPDLGGLSVSEYPRQLRVCRPVNRPSVIRAWLKQNVKCVYHVGLSEA
jgi:hypothetical protein